METAERDVKQSKQTDLNQNWMKLPLTRMTRLQWQYSDTPHSWTPSSTPQDKLQGQGRLQRLIQRRETRPQGQHGSPPPERLQIQYRDYMRLLRLMAPQGRRGVQGCRTGMPPLWHFSKVCRQRSDYQHSEKTAVKHIDTEEQPTDYFQSEYTIPYFITNEQDYSQNSPYPGQGYRTY